ncbi:SAM-dependent methyltransferase [bacterium]|nr:MAG: SAM-dependent methyltransferase [bacterium]
MATDRNIAWSYNNYAKEWVRQRRAGWSAHEYLEKPAMYAKLPNLKNKSILCVGCGSGEECNYIKSLGVKRIVGIDISKELINYAKKSYPDIEFYVMNMEKLDFPRSSFDFVYSSLVFHYLRDWTKALKGIYKVLKNDGILLFSTHHPIKWGAEKDRIGKTEKRSKDKRWVLMGYVKYNDKKRYKIYGDYLNPRKVKDIWFDEFEISYYHKPLSLIIKKILDSGFKIVDFIEPKPINSLKNKDRRFWEIYRKIPLFMIFELKKDKK